MCLVCFAEFTSYNPPVDLGCGHCTCSRCAASLHDGCPVCGRSVAPAAAGPPAAPQLWASSSSIGSSGGGGGGGGGGLHLFAEGLSYSLRGGATPRTTKARYAAGPDPDDGFDDASDLLDVGPCPGPPRSPAAALEGEQLGGSSTGGASTSSSASSSGIVGDNSGGGSGRNSSGGGGGGTVSRLRRTGGCLAVCTTVLLRGTLAASQAVLRRLVVPATLASGSAGQAILSGAAQALLASGGAVARTACRSARFVRAKRHVLEDLDSSLQPHLHHVPPLLSNLHGRRIILRDCSRLRVLVEYCTDCVLVASGLHDVELLLVGCSRVKLVLKRCTSLALREIQCSAMADHVRRDCPGFVHDVVCLRCACSQQAAHLNNQHQQQHHQQQQQHHHQQHHAHVQHHHQYQHQQLRESIRESIGGAYVSMQQLGWAY